MNHIKITLLLVFIGLCFTSVQADQPAYVKDSTHVEVRQFDQTKIEELKADPDMDYGRSPAGVSLWERFKRWIKRLLSQILNTVASTDWMNVVIVALVLAGAVYLIIWWFKSKDYKMFYSDSVEKLNHGVLHEDIHALDFEKLISEALQRKEYRLAIRLLFLQALKLLADTEHIHWQPGKTNHDYVEELQSGKLKSGFNELSFYFEFAWYGNFSVNETLYQKVNSLFNNWKVNV
jgi:hypothetical protein